MVSGLWSVNRGEQKGKAGGGCALYCVDYKRLVRSAHPTVETRGECPDLSANYEAVGGDHFAENLFIQSQPESGGVGDVDMSIGDFIAGGVQTGG